MQHPPARFLLVLAALPALACAPEEPRDAASPAPSAAASQAASLGPSTLAYFEPVPDAMGWIRLDPDRPEGDAARREVLAFLPMTDATPHAAWRADGRKALIWYDTNTLEDATPPPPQLWEVDVAAKTKVALPRPAAGQLDGLGYDAQGRAIALTGPDWRNVTDPKADKKGRYFLFEGKRYDVPTDREGQAVLVHAFALQPDNTWKRIETMVSDTGWDMAMGSKRLAAAEGLGARTPDLLTSHPDTAEPDAKTRAALEALVPATVKATKAQEGEWALLAPSAGRLAVWQEQGGEFLHATERVVFTQDPVALVPGLAIPAPAASAKALIQGGEGASGLRAVAAQVRGDRLLVSDAHDGEHPRLIDLPSRKLVFESDLARGVVFWPAPQP